MPGGTRAGIDDFRGKQLPEFTPVDDLSRFVLDRIREAETEPVADMIPERHDEQPVAYRYAKNIREDCIAFRRIAAAYCEAKAEWESCDSQAGRHDRGLFSAGLAEAVREIARRWSGHADFRDEWRLA